MIQIGETTLDFRDPVTLGITLAGVAFLVLFCMVFIGLRRAGRSAQISDTMMRQMGGLGHRVEALASGQQQLFGGLTTVSEAQAQQQARTLQLMEQRLAEVTEKMTENLQGSATRTARRS